MTEKYRFFDSATGDTREYNADQFGEYFRTLINTGLVKGALNDLEVTADGLTMNSTINTGNVFIDGYWYENDASLALEHDVETVGNDRIDRVVIRLDKTVSNRFIKAVITKGTAAVSPTAPALTRTANVYELSLAQVLITGGQSFIEQTDITDERGDATLCPYADSNILPSFDAQDLQNLRDEVIAHEADYTAHVPHLGITTNVGNNYSVTNTKTIGDGAKFSVKFNAAATNTATLNISSDGTARTLKKPDGSDFKPKAGIYSFIRDGVNFQLLGEGGEYGTATAAQVLAPNTIGTENGIVTGTMPNRGTFNLALGASVPAGYYSGGSVPNGKGFASGTSIADSSSFITIAGLSFMPRIIIVAMGVNRTYMNRDWTTTVAFTEGSTTFTGCSMSSNGAYVRAWGANIGNTVSWNAYE